MTAFRGATLAFAAYLLLVPDPGAGADRDVVVATVGARSITAPELEKHVKGRLIQLEQERYEALKAGLDELVADELLRLEAKARGTTPEALTRQEIDARVVDPSDAEVSKFYNDNKEGMGGATLQQERPKIVRYLREPKTQERRAAFLGELRGKYRTTVALKAPVIEVGTAGRPERGGGTKAPVTMVMFSDYQCGYCRQVEPVVEQVLKYYGDKVRLVVRDLPLSIHPDARLAAEAAACANAQGKFWDYHDQLFDHQAALGEAQLMGYAREVGLDRPKFDQCLRERAFKAAIDRDMADAADVGINGTPVFVVNGRIILGVVSFASFKEVIDEALGPAPGATGAGATAGTQVVR